MPPRYRKKNYRKKTPWYNKKYNALQIAGKALSGVKYLKGLVNSEMLHVNQVNAAGIDYNGTIYHLTNIGQDDTASGRTGNSLLLKSVFLRVKFEKDASATSSSCIKMMIIQDKQQVSDTTPAISDILESSGNIYSPLSPLKIGSSGRYKILYSKQFTLDVTGGWTSKVIEKYIPMYLHVRYNGTAGTDIQKNGIYVIFISDKVTTLLPTQTMYSRLGYHDN